MGTHTVNLDHDRFGLNFLMEFEHVVTVNADGTVTDDDQPYHAPEVEVGTDRDGQILAEHERGMIEYVRMQGWEPLTGYTGQYSYSGPIMHPSEFIGGALAEYVLSTPGTYVAVAVETVSPDPDADPEPAGWMVLRHRNGD